MASETNMEKFQVHLIKYAHSIYFGLKMGYILENVVCLPNFNVDLWRAGNKSKTYLVGSKLYTVIYYTFFILALLIAVWTNDFLEVFKKYNLFFRLVAVYEKYSHIIGIIAIISAYKIQKTDIKNLYIYLRKVDKKLIELNVEIKQNMEKWLQVWIILKTVIVIILYIHANLTNNLSIFHLITNFLYFLSNIYKLFTAITFRSWIQIIKKRFLLINKKMNSLRSNWEIPVSELSIIHQDLYEMTASINTIFSISVLLNLGINFLAVTIKTYVLLTSLYKNASTNLSDLLFNFVWLFSNAFDGTSLVLLCSQFTRHVSIIELVLLVFNDRI